MSWPKGSPARYELDIWGNSLVVNIHESALEILENVCIHSSAVCRVKERIGDRLPNFDNDKLGWGFGRGLLKQEGRKKGWVSWHCAMPKPLSDIRQTRLLRLSATLELLFWYLETSTFPKLTEGRSELIHFDNWHASALPNEPGIHVYLHRNLCQWLINQLDGKDTARLPVVENEMRIILDSSSTIRQRFSKYEVGSKVKRDPFELSLFVTTRRTRCALKTEKYFKPEEEEWLGAEAKNIAQPLQQLLLLVALASLHKQARYHML